MLVYPWVIFLGSRVKLETSDKVALCGWMIKAYGVIRKMTATFLLMVVMMIMIMIMVITHFITFQVEEFSCILTMLIVLSWGWPVGPSHYLRLWLGKRPLTTVTPIYPPLSISVWKVSRPPNLKPYDLSLRKLGSPGLLQIWLPPICPDVDTMPQASA